MPYVYPYKSKNRKACFSAKHLYKLSQWVPLPNKGLNVFPWVRAARAQELPQNQAPLVRTRREAEEKK
jgi:hypothetical protein